MEASPERRLNFASVGFTRHGFSNLGAHHWDFYGQPLCPPFYQSDDDGFGLARLLSVNDCFPKLSKLFPWGGKIKANC